MSYTTALSRLNIIKAPSFPEHKSFGETGFSCHCFGRQPSGTPNYRPVLATVRQLQTGYVDNAKFSRRGLVRRTAGLVTDPPWLERNAVVKDQ
jgi:hypothetical protein